MGRPLVLLRTVPSKVTTAPSAPVSSLRDQGPGVDGVTGQREVIAADRDFRQFRACAAGYGRQKGDFVALLDLGGKFGKLLIAGHHNTARNLPQTRILGSVGFENVAKVGALGEFGFLRPIARPLP